MIEQNHDPLCPQQPRADGATLEMRNGKVVYCGCDLIAEVIAAAVQRVEALEVLLVNVRFYLDGHDDHKQAVLLSECIDAIKGDES